MDKRFETPYIVHPCGEHSQLYSFSNGALSPAAKLPYAWGSPFFLFGTKWLATLVKDGRRLRVDIIDRGKIENSVTLDAPHKGRFHSVRMIGDVAYIGGASESAECMWLVDLAETSPSLNPVILPPNARGTGKAIDDFVVQGNTLIAVDDLLLPKYFIRYDIRTPNKPTFLSSVKIPPTTTYESIQCAVEGERVFVTLNSGFGRLGSTQTLVAYQYDSLEQTGQIGGSQQDFRNDKFTAWIGLEYHDGLFIIYTRKVIGIVEETQLMGSAQRLSRKNLTREQREAMRPTLKYLPIEILSDGHLTTLVTMTVQDGSAILAGTADAKEEMKNIVITNLKEKLRQA